jgi:hypothetical protein
MIKMPNRKYKRHSQNTIKFIAIIIIVFSSMLVFTFSNTNNEYDEIDSYWETVGDAEFKMLEIYNQMVELSPEKQEIEMNIDIHGILVLNSDYANYANFSYTKDSYNIILTGYNGNEEFHHIGSFGIRTKNITNLAYKLATFSDEYSGEEAVFALGALDLIYTVNSFYILSEETKEVNETYQQTTVEFIMNVILEYE